ncbi:double-strand break repair protein AddB, partial [Rhodobacterales bacterium HKCCE3408]|nr:double-strand break repair protein AddB [Rhodobacterales bacterium HKCCE3408]
PARREGPAPRPAPAPPAEARPKRLSVTQVERLIRDPYAIYAAKVLRLRPLDPLKPAADARLRGEILHRIVQRFVEEGGEISEARLVDIAAEELERAGEWPVAAQLWRAAIARAAPAFVAGEQARRDIAEPLHFEEKGGVVLPGELELIAKADRIDAMPDGRLVLYDYKSGRVPSEKEERAFAQQLRLEAVIAARGGFGDPVDVARAAYVGLTAGGKSYEFDLTPEEIAETERRLLKLWAVFLTEGHGFISRRAMAKVNYPGDYDHLARYGEWDEAQPATVIEVGR